MIGFVTWFLGAVDDFRFFDLQVYACADPDSAVAEVKAEGLIKPTGRRYRQEYVVFLRAAGGKIRSSGKISIPCVQPRRWTRQFLVSNLRTRGNGPVTRAVTLLGARSHGIGRVCHCFEFHRRFSRTPARVRCAVCARFDRLAR